MSTSCLLTTEAAKDIKFKDMDELQEKIREELECDEDDDVLEIKGGKLLVRDMENMEFGEAAEVYGMWKLQTSQMLSKHMTQGRLLIRLMPEGFSDELHLITPNKAEEIDVSKVLGF